MFTFCFLLMGPFTGAPLLSVAVLRREGCSSAKVGSVGCKTRRRVAVSRKSTSPWQRDVYLGEPETS